MQVDQILSIKLIFPELIILAILSDFYEKICEVFMDDFSVYGSSFDDCLRNLDRVLRRYEDTSLV